MCQPVQREVLVALLVLRIGDLDCRVTEIGHALVCALTMCLEPRCLFRLGCTAVATTFFLNNHLVLAVVLYSTFDHPVLSLTQLPQALSGSS